MAKPSRTPLPSWWWRRVVFLSFDERDHITQWKYPEEFDRYGSSGSLITWLSSEWNTWHRCNELTAWRYEFLRRLAFPNLPEWPFLPAWQRRWVDGVLAPPKQRSVCARFHPVAPPNYVSLQAWQWDLTASDESLCQHFLLRINDERRKNGLPETDDPFKRFTGENRKGALKRRGDRNRSVSWLAVEAFDLQKQGAVVLTDGERSRLSKAKRELKTLVPTLASALEHAEKMTHPDDKAASLKSYFSQFLSENFPSFIASRIRPEG